MDNSHTWPQNIRSGDIFVDPEFQDAVVILAFFNQGTTIPNIVNEMYIQSDIQRILLNREFSDFFGDINEIKDDIQTSRIYAGNISEGLCDLVQRLISEIGTR